MTPLSCFRPPPPSTPENPPYRTSLPRQPVQFTSTSLSHLHGFNRDTPFAPASDRDIITVEHSNACWRDDPDVSGSTWQITLEARFLVDIGDKLFGRKKALHIGTEADVWWNEYGIKDQDDVVPQLLLKAHFQAEDPLIDVWSAGFSPMPSRIGAGIRTDRHFLITDSDVTGSLKKSIRAIRVIRVEKPPPQTLDIQNYEIGPHAYDPTWRLQSSTALG